MTLSNNYFLPRNLVNLGNLPRNTIWHQNFKLTSPNYQFHNLSVFQIRYHRSFAERKIIHVRHFSLHYSQAFSLGIKFQTVVDSFISTFLPNRYSLYNMKTCLPRKTAKPRSVEHFYSSGPRPTLRMVDGDIVVVSTNGKVLRHQAPGDQTTLETSDNSNHQNQTQVSQQTESLSLTRTRTMTSERVPPEIPFHLISPPEVQSMTLSSGM